ncbi:hypothetical protein [Bacillus marinisedimentorum]|uniref:hypothetical protein n=1 Tax=Bacillus marinisedimentorum TaxID=1821260 RepID=UPI0008724482|nr:hypothetical protein [Bacillus marinisedimentorum]
MDAVYMVSGSLVIITCFYFVIAPFFTQGKTAAASNEGESVSLELIYESINEAEMDYLMKKISKEDFEEMKQQYYNLASGQLKGNRPANRRQKEAAGGTVPVDEEILKELQKIRGGRG